MAWSAPPAFTVSQIVTAAQMNILSDDLKYLKGQAGTVAIEAAMTVTTSLTAPTVLVTKAGQAAFDLIDTVTGGTPAAGAAWRLFADNVGGGGGSCTFGFYDINNGLRMGIDNSGNVGINTSTPQGRLHAVSAAGGFMYLTAIAVDGTLRTMAVAGTITYGMVVWVFDRNNTGGGVVLGFNGQAFALTNANAYANTDTLTVTLTAGGGITIQRTAGSNGTHDINMLVLYR